MDPNLGSQIVFGVIGLMAGLGVILTLGACWSLGRAHYRR